MLFLDFKDFVFRLTERLTNVIQVDSPIELSDRDRPGKYIDREKGRNLQVACVNTLIIECKAAPYLRDIVINLFRGLAAIVTLNL